MTSTELLAQNFKTSKGKTLTYGGSQNIALHQSGSE